MAFVLVSIVSMLVVLGILVLVHEAGHFVVAKLCGVRVETFSIGFGTRLFGFKRGGTDYCVRVLPLGGYVKMSGELPVEEATGDPSEYASHPRWQRILIACAGPAANVLLALVIMTVVYMAHNEVPNFLSGAATIDYVQPGSAAADAGLQHGDRIVAYDGVHNPTWQQVYLHTVLNLGHPVSMQVEQRDRPGAQPEPITLEVPAQADPDDFALEDVGFTAAQQNSPLTVADVLPDMPGYRAGLRAGDQLQAVNGIPFRSLSSIALYLQQDAGKPVTLDLLRHSAPVTLTVQPKQTTTTVTGKPAYQIGFNVDPPPSHVERLSLTQAIGQSAHDNAKNSTLIVDVLRRIVTMKMSVRTLSGPVGIARQTGHIVAMPGWTPLMSETAMLSLNLGILNLLPIPILDGGVILMLLIEGIMRRDMNQALKERVYQTAFVFLILMTALVLVNDIAKIPIIAHLKP